MIHDITKQISESDDVYKTLAYLLDPFKNEEELSQKFLVENKDKVQIILSYPGRKKSKLNWTPKRKIFYKNLYDFQVESKIGSKYYDANALTHNNLFIDFEQYKKDNKEYWKAFEKVFDLNKVDLTDIDFNIGGMPAKMLLYALKYIWIQEDFNYKLNDNNFDCPTVYRNKIVGLGRIKSFSRFLLMKENRLQAKDCYKI